MHKTQLAPMNVSPLQRPPETLVGTVTFAAALWSLCSYGFPVTNSDRRASRSKRPENIHAQLKVYVLVTTRIHRDDVKLEHVETKLTVVMSASCQGWSPHSHSSTGPRIASRMSSTPSDS